MPAFGKGHLRDEAGPIEAGAAVCGAGARDLDLKDAVVQDDAVRACGSRRMRGLGHIRSPLVLSDAVSSSIVIITDERLRAAYRFLSFYCLDKMRYIS